MLSWYMKGCYIQGKGGIIVGDYTQIAPNVVIVSANHDLYDSPKNTFVNLFESAKYCWIGAGLKLCWSNFGNWTIVGAGQW